MPSNPISVKMLGGFSVEWNGNTVSDQNNRMKKVWLLLAYLLYHRNHHIPLEQYISLLQSKSGEEVSDPSGSVKAIFYRLRSMLDQLGDSAGHTLILRQNGSYAWNSEIPLCLDTEEFDELYRKAGETEDDAARLTLFCRMLELYRGGFLPKLSSEPWVMPIAAYYHQIYIDTAEKAMALMEAQSRWDELSVLCESALKIEAYHESFYQHLMRSKLVCGDRSAALRIYEDMSELLFSTFGVMPSDESRALYRKAMRNDDTLSLPAGAVHEDLKEADQSSGALFCEYDFFKLLYQAQARALIRSGDVIHTVLFSIHARGKQELPRRSLDRAAENLKELLIANLRQGDVVTQCSASQFIIMLPQANYENSCMVCERLLRAFYRQYPHSPTELKFSVQPLEPLSSSPSFK